MKKLISTALLLTTFLSSMAYAQTPSSLKLNYVESVDESELKAEEKRDIITLLREMEILRQQVNQYKERNVAAAEEIALLKFQLEAKDKVITIYQQIEALQEEKDKLYKQNMAYMQDMFEKSQKRADALEKQNEWQKWMMPIGVLLGIGISAAIAAIAN